MLLMIDNYDSFTYNVVQYFAQLGVEVRVFKNDAISCDEISRLQPQFIVISPGPGTPDNAGVSMQVIESFASKIPILGICLGHQCIGQVFGARVVRAKKVMHGKTSSIRHNGSGVFAALPRTFEVTRYHSLVLEKSSLPECFGLTAWTQSDGDEPQEIMGIRHKEYAVEGVQFHPESVLTEHGLLLLKNFLEQNSGKSISGIPETQYANTTGD